MGLLADCGEHADLPLPAGRRSHGREQLRVGVCPSPRHPARAAGGTWLSPSHLLCVWPPPTWHSGFLWDSCTPLGGMCGSVCGWWQLWLLLPSSGSDTLSFLGRLQAGLPPYSPVFKSWIHCWKYLSVQVSMHSREFSPHFSIAVIIWKDFCIPFITWKVKGLSWNPYLLKVNFTLFRRGLRCLDLNFLKD